MTARIYVVVGEEGRRHNRDVWYSGRIAGEVTKMTAIKPQAPHEASGTWISRHKIWTAVLVLLVLAVATGAVLCTIY